MFVFVSLEHALTRFDLEIPLELSQKIFLLKRCNICSGIRFQKTLKDGLLGKRLQNALNKA